MQREPRCCTCTLSGVSHVRSPWAPGHVQIFFGGELRGTGTFRWTERSRHN